MRVERAVALLLLVLPIAALGKNKKNDLPAVFGNATYVYVESEDGDALKPGLYPDDRRAIADVQDALHDWNRYKLTMRRSQAELVLVVRKGRIANGRIGVNVPGGAPLPSGQAPGQGPGHGPGSAGGGPGVGVGAEAGPEDDMLRVYTLDPDGKLIGPIWNRSEPEGLAAPQLGLFRQLKSAVERAYPASAPPKP
jgi:hypothetical protein